MAVTAALKSYGGRPTVETQPDIVIIGSGTGGATLASGLAGSGASILILERGDYLEFTAQARDAHAVFIEKTFRTSELWRNARGKLVRPSHYYCVGGNSKFYGTILIRYRSQDCFAMCEDLPDLDSRVFVDGEQIVLNWKRTNTEALRRLVGLTRAKLRECGFPVVLSQRYTEENPGHQCGTVRIEPIRRPLHWIPIAGLGPEKPVRRRRQFSAKFSGGESFADNCRTSTAHCQPYSQAMTISASGAGARQSSHPPYPGLPRNAPPPAVGTCERC